MPRKRTQRVQQLKTMLMQRITTGMYHPGDRFLSTRAVAQRFAVSFQTAHFILDELVQEGLLERRPNSGTFISGSPESMNGVEIVFASGREICV